MISFSKASKKFSINNNSSKENTPAPGQYSTEKSFIRDTTEISFKRSTSSYFKKKIEKRPGFSYNAVREGVISKEKHAPIVSFSKERRWKGKKKSKKFKDGEGIDDENSAPISYLKREDIDLIGKDTPAISFGKRYVEKPKGTTVHTYFKDDFEKSLSGKPKTVFGKEKRILKWHNGLEEVTPSPHDYQNNEFKTDHQSFAFGNADRSKGFIFNKYSETVNLGKTSTWGPKYNPNYDIVLKNTKNTLKIAKPTVSKQISHLKQRRVPGVGSYDVKKQKMNCHAFSMPGKEKEVFDVFTNTTRKARFIHGQLGLLSPGPKYKPAIVETKIKHSFSLDGLNKPKRKKKTLGAKYNVNYKLTEKSSRKTKFSKSAKFSNKKKKNNTPGPGQYYNPGLRAMNRNVVRWKAGKRKKSLKLGADSPGVGKYNPINYYDKYKYRGGNRFGALKPLKYV